MGKEPILDGERVVGYVTSANYGYTVGSGIAYGYLPLSPAAVGTKIAIQYFGLRFLAVTHAPAILSTDHLRTSFGSPSRTLTPPSRPLTALSGA